MKKTNYKFLLIIMVTICAFFINISNVKAQSFKNFTETSEFAETLREKACGVSCSSIEECKKKNGSLSVYKDCGDDLSCYKSEYDTCKIKLEQYTKGTCYTTKLVDDCGSKQSSYDYNNCSKASFLSCLPSNAGKINSDLGYFYYNLFNNSIDSVISSLKKSPGCDTYCDMKCIRENSYTSDKKESCIKTCTSTCNNSDMCVAQCHPESDYASCATNCNPENFRYQPDTSKTIIKKKMDEFFDNESWLNKEAVENFINNCNSECESTISDEKELSVCKSNCEVLYKATSCAVKCTAGSPDYDYCINTCKNIEGEIDFTYEYDTECAERCEAGCKISHGSDKSGYPEFENCVSNCQIGCRINNNSLSSSSNSDDEPIYKEADVEVNCSDFSVFNKLWKIIIITAPFITIALGVMDLIKMVVATDEKEAKKQKKNLTIRIVALILLVLTPTLVYVLLTTIGLKNNRYLKAMRCVVVGK